MNKTPRNSEYLKYGLELGNLLKIASIVGGTWSIWFVYSYLDMVGRSDVFVDALGAMSAVGYILAIGVLFGILALLSLLVPSYLLVLTHEEMKRFVIKPKHPLLARRLLYLASGGMAALIIAIFVVPFIEAEMSNQAINPGITIGLMALLFLITFFFSISKPMVKPRKKIKKDGTYEFSCWDCFRLKASTTILWGIISFAASISAIFVSIAVLKLNQWGEGIWPTFLAMSLVMVNMQATLLPAFFYLFSEDWKAPQKWIGAGLGTFLFITIIISSTPLIINTLTFNVAKGIAVNDARAWMYHIDTERLDGVFRGSAWWNEEDTGPKQTKSVDKEPENQYIVAKLLYGMGGVKLLCPRSVDIEVSKLETLRERANDCILVDSSAVTKIGLHQSSRSGSTVESADAPGTERST